MNFTRIQALGIVAVALTTTTSSALAVSPPSNEHPDGVLSVRPIEEHQRLQKHGYELSKNIGYALGVLDGKLQSNKLQKADLDQIGRINADLTRLERVADQLVWSAEAAGVELQLRRNEHTAALTNLIAACRRIPQVSSYLIAERDERFAELQKLRTDLGKADQAARSNRWLKARDIVWQMMDKIRLWDCWYPGDKRFDDFYLANRAVHERMEQSHTAQTKEVLAERRAALAPQYDELVASVTSAAQSIGAGRAPTWEGATLDGPQILENTFDRWKQLHINTLRCRALDAVLNYAAGATRPDPETDLDAAYREFTQQLSDAIGAMILADAQRVSPSDARARYLEYLNVASSMRAIGDDETALPISSALQQFVTVSAPLTAEVEAYRAATSDLLRWRRRTAESLAAARQGASTVLEDAYLDAVKGGRGQPGLTLESTRSTSEVGLPTKVSLATVMPFVVESLQGSNVVVGQITGLRAGGNLGVSRYQFRAYSRVALPAIVEEAAAALEEDLLVSAEFPPLTLEAADAVATARHGDLETAAGEVVGFAVEPLMNRFIELPDLGWTIVPLGSLPDLGVKPPLTQLLVRFDIQPAWVRHEYFLADVE